MLLNITHIITTSLKASAKRCLLICLFLTTFLILLSIKCNAADGIRTVAITQIVAHDSLNKVRDGIIDRLKEQYGDGINIELLMLRKRIPANNLT
jgi:ABC-type uncharacterized transport system substrate-binding protein